MNKKRFIKPEKPTLVIRDPANGKPLPADGAEVTWSTFWARRYRDGSVVDAKPPKPVKAAATKPVPKKEATDA